MNLASTNMAEVIKGAHLIIVSVPAFAHQFMMQEAVKYLEKGQTVLIVPGNYGSIRLYNLLKERDLQGKIDIAETISMLYACRKTVSGQVHIRAIKKELPVAALPSSRTDFIIRELSGFYTGFTPQTSVLETSLNNLNCIVHTTTSILNAGWIEYTKGKFDFYTHGITPSVGRIMEQIDRERIEVGRKMGYKLPDFLQIMKDFYGLEGNNIYKVLSTSKVHGKSNAPENLHARYISEDVPYGLVPISSLGKHFGVNTPTINSLIELASKMNNINYWQEGITVEKLGLKNMRKEELRNFLLSGQ